MREVLNLIRNFFFYDIVADINLYTIISTIVKFLFVYIVLYYIYIIVKLIVLDINNIENTKRKKQYYLIIRSNDKSSKKYILDYNTTIGRAFSNDIVLENQSVSSHHAKLVKYEDAFYIVDLNSSNGTLLNGEYVSENLELMDGDIIEISDYIIEFKEELIDVETRNDEYINVDNDSKGGN